MPFSPPLYSVPPPPAPPGAYVPAKQIGQKAHDLTWINRALAPEICRWIINSGCDYAIIANGKLEDWLAANGPWPGYQNSPASEFRNKNTRIAKTAADWLLANGYTSLLAEAARKRDAFAAATLTKHPKLDASVPLLRPATTYADKLAQDEALPALTAQIATARAAQAQESATSLAGTVAQDQALSVPWMHTGTTHPRSILVEQQNFEVWNNEHDYGYFARLEISPELHYHKAYFAPAFILNTTSPNPGEIVIKGSIRLLLRGNTIWRMPFQWVERYDMYGTFSSYGRTFWPLYKPGNTALDSIEDGLVLQHWSMPHPSHALIVYPWIIQGQADTFIAEIATLKYTSGTMYWKSYAQVQSANMPF